MQGRRWAPCSRLRVQRASAAIFEKGNPDSSAKEVAVIYIFKCSGRLGRIRGLRVEADGSLSLLPHFLGQPRSYLAF